MKYRRAKVPGGTYFFTVNLAERHKPLLIDHVNELRHAISTIKRQHPFKINAVVILPDHLHMVMTLPSEDENYSQRLNLIKNRFSRSFRDHELIIPSRRNKRERGIWQRRFWEHLIINENDYEDHVNYVHYNPVKHGYVEKLRDWPYSSIHRYIANGILPENWGHSLNDFHGNFGE